MMLTYKANSLRQFMKRIQEIRRAWETKKDAKPDLWYRGFQKSSWALVPKLYRPRFPAKELRQKEDEIREEFARRAPCLTAYRPENAWEWYVLMQHYGGPTRLLDWTEDPLIGLYFAVKDSEGLQDAAVCVLDPWLLNQRVLGKDEVLPPGSAGLSIKDLRRYNPWLPDRFDAKQRLRKKLPVAIYPNQFDRRIAAQRSCFTVHGTQTDSLDELFPELERLLAKIIIPGYAVDRVREDLDGYGVDEATVYPDLEGLGKCVARWLPTNEEVAHEGLYTRLQPSPIDGVGVFSIKNIKKGTLIFSGDSDEVRWVRAEDLPKEGCLREFYDKFAIVKNGKNGHPEWYGVPRNFHRLTMSWYLNDPKPGEKPNVRCDENYDFWSSQPIKQGDELTVDSHSYSDHAKPKPGDSKGSRKNKPT
jgi:hypothetical protein